MHATMATSRMEGWVVQVSWKSNNVCMHVCVYIYINMRAYIYIYICFCVCLCSSQDLRCCAMHATMATSRMEGWVVQVSGKSNNVCINVCIYTYIYI